MNKVKVGIHGSQGRMGKDILCRAKSFHNLEISFLCEHSKHSSVGKKESNLIISGNASDLINNSDVIIDFTNAEGTLNLMNLISQSKKKPAVVTGTTGFSKSEETKFYNLV